MGGFYHSLSLPRSVHSQAESLVSSWLFARGFERAEDGVLDLDREAERGCLIFWGEGWTTVLYSHFEEEDRLRLELEKLELPLLHVWLHDSDLWGYELYEEGDVVSAFNSNPRYFGSETGAEGPNDTARIARAWFGDERRAGELLALQKKKGIFLDPVCERFARWLGAPPAASQYAYVTAGERLWDGLPEIHLRFRRPGFDPMDGFDLHRLRVESPPLEEAGEPWRPSPGFRLLTGAIRLLFFPLSLYARLKLRFAKKATLGLPETGSVPEPEWKVEGSFLVNERRRCRVSLAHGAEVARGLGILPLQVGPLPVTASVRSGAMVAAGLNNLRGREIQSDERFHVGDFPARFVASTWPEPRRFIYDFYIATQIAVYWFQASVAEPPGEDTLTRLRATVESFELLPRSEP
ncbi:MAG TPA: hypothetical protein VJ725_20860 [Thermoanaerobaculia bacterium]|nr:hypothetical protein [Thermoanaerobaculia bacterium]